jgi:hypothetical protein
MQKGSLSFRFAGNNDPPGQLNTPLLVRSEYFTDLVSYENRSPPTFSKQQMVKILIVLVILSGLIFSIVAKAEESMRANIEKKADKWSAREAETEDFVPLPPSRTEAVSPNGQYLLVVQSTDEWKSKHPAGRLFHQTALGPQLIWKKDLPQEYGPRYALVGNQGQAIFFDEYINVKSRYAVMLINYQKHLEISHDFDNIAELLDMPVASIVKNATGGWWMIGEPMLDVSGTTAVVCAAQKRLQIDLNTGQLSVVNSSQTSTQQAR